MRRPRLISRLAASVLAVATLGASVLVAHPPAEFLHKDDLVKHSAEGDIAALRNYHTQARAAADRLVRRGESVLPQVHAALAAPDGNDKQREQLVVVLGEVGRPESAGPILATVRAHADEPALTRAALRVLPYLTTEFVGSELAGEILGDPEAHPYLKRQALAYFGMVRDPRGLEWAETYRSSNDVYVLAGALWAAARLGDTTAGDAAVGALRPGSRGSLRHDLMLTAAEVMEPDVLKRVVPQTMQSTPEFANALVYSQFRHGSDDRRRQAAEQLLRGRYAHEKIVAGEYLVQHLGPEEFVRQFGDPDRKAGVQAAARRALRRAGFRVVQEGERLKVQGQLP